jgi:hypothetical protein
MKPLTEKVWRVASNAWGRPSGAFHQDFEIEASDVGYNKPHMGGFNHNWHVFTQADVGRKINQMTDGTGWTCWSFSNG